MSITSYGFLLFAGLLLLLYYRTPRKYQWRLLLAASYAFYAFSGVKYLGYILATTLCTYGVSRKIGGLKEHQEAFFKENKAILDREDKKLYKASVKKRQRAWLTFALLFNFGILAVIKYGNFVVSNVGALFGGQGDAFFHLALPLGISFYTFQTTGYLIDLYRGEYREEKNFFRLSLFVSYFPQLIQGPISRFGALSKELFDGHAFDRRQAAFGLQRMLYGFFKKLVIADRIMKGLATISGDPAVYSGTYAFVGGIDIVSAFRRLWGLRFRKTSNGRILRSASRITGAAGT